MSKLIWEHSSPHSEIGSTGHLCMIDVYEAKIRIGYGADAIFTFAMSVMCETDTITGEKLILADYSPQGEYGDLFLPLDDENTEYESVDAAKAACENKATEIIKYLYKKLEILIDRLSCD